MRQHLITKKWAQSVEYLLGMKKKLDGARMKLDELVAAGDARLRPLEQTMNAALEAWVSASAAYESQRIENEMDRMPLQMELSDLMAQIAELSSSTAQKH